MFKVEKRVGRLVEGTICSPLLPGEVASIVQQMRLNILAAPGKAVCVGDLTRFDVMPPDAADAFTAMFTRDNPRLERTAFLLSRRLGSLGVQVERMIREAGGPTRRTFDDKDALARWLGEVLDAAERARLREFLDESGDGPPTSVSGLKRSP